MTINNPAVAADRARARRSDGDFLDVLDAVLSGDKATAITLTRRAGYGDDVEALLRKRMA